MPTAWRPTVLWNAIPWDRWSEVEQRIGGMAERGVVIQPGMTLDDLHAERHPLYMKYADIVIDCSGKAQDELLAEIRSLEPWCDRSTLSPTG